MTHEFWPITDPQELADELEDQLRMPDTANAVLADLGGGILRFAGVIFPELDLDKVYARTFKFGLENLGPHFDLQSIPVDSAYPWVGLYNLSGRSSVQTTRLPDVLFRDYESAFPNHGDAILHARMSFGRITSLYPELDVATGEFISGMGLVLPQVKDGSQIIHKITSFDAQNPGEFIKLTSVDSEISTEEIAEYAYVTLDELVTRGLGGLRPRNINRNTPETKSLVADEERERCFSGAELLREMVTDTI